MGEHGLSRRGRVAGVSVFCSAPKRFAGTAPIPLARAQIQLSFARAQFEDLFTPFQLFELFDTLAPSGYVVQSSRGRRPGRGEGTVVRARGRWGRQDIKRLPLIRGRRECALLRRGRTRRFADRLVFARQVRHAERQPRDIARRRRRGPRLQPSQSSIEAKKKMTARTDRAYFSRIVATTLPLLFIVSVLSTRLD